MHYNEPLLIISLLEVTSVSVVQFNVYFDGNDNLINFYDTWNFFTKDFNNFY